MNKFIVLILIVFSLFSCSTLQRARRGLTSRNCTSDEIRISLDRTFPNNYASIINDVLPLLSRWDVRGRVVTNGNYDLYIRNWAKTCSEPALGRYTHGTGFVDISPECTYTETQFRAVVLHEIGHWLGLDHICMPSGETTDHCSPVGRGRAIMNPYIAYDHPLEITELDLAERRRVCNSHPQEGN